MAEQTGISLKVFRFDPDKDQEPHYDTFPLQPKAGMTVLEALFVVLEQQDPSLAFRYSCRGAVCGSCAMFINGSYRLACETQVSNLGTAEVRVGPLPHLPLIKDLVVDMTPFFEKYERIMPYLITKDGHPQKERLQSPKERKALDGIIDCILCASCYSSCPMTWTDKDYLGPAALNQLYRFVADSRDEAKSQRLKMVTDESGVLRCHTVFNCTEVCPKHVDPNYGIQQLKRKALSQRLKIWKGGR